MTSGSRIECASFRWSQAKPRLFPFQAVWLTWGVCTEAPLSEKFFVSAPAPPVGTLRLAASRTRWVMTQCIARGDIAITFAAHHIVRDTVRLFESDNLTQTFLTLSDPLPVFAGDSECKVERLRHEHFGSTKRSTASSASGRSGKESASVSWRTRPSADSSSGTCTLIGSVSSRCRERRSHG